jgi:hypothetical protein
MKHLTFMRSNPNVEAVRRKPPNGSSLSLEEEASLSTCPTVGELSRLSLFTTKGSAERAQVRLAPATVSIESLSGDALRLLD